MLALFCTATTPVNEKLLKKNGPNFPLFSVSEDQQIKINNLLEHFIGIYSVALCAWKKCVKQLG